MKYIKKPVEVEAIQFDGYNWKECKQFMSKEELMFPCAEYQVDCLIIHSEFGMMTAHVGDWIIKGCQGEFYPCTNEIFVETYKEV